MSSSERAGPIAVEIRAFNPESPGQTSPVEILLLDGYRREAARGVGWLAATVEAGHYIARVAEAEPAERFVSLWPGGPSRIEIAVRAPASAPIDGTATAHEFHAEPAALLTQKPTAPALGRGARFVVFARNLVPRGATAAVDPRLRAPVPLENLALCPGDAAWRASAGADASATSDVSWRNLAESSVGDPDFGWRGASFDVTPGPFVLRWTEPRAPGRQFWQNPARVIEQALWIPPAWTLILFVGCDPERGLLLRQTASFELAELALGWKSSGSEAEETLAMEVALDGLRRGKVLMSNEQQHGLLYGKFRNPMLGIVGAHVLLESQPSDERAQWLDEVIRNLERLVGPHPDVQALRLAATRRRGGEGSPAEPFDFPPMMYAGYRRLIDADADRAAVIVDGGVLDHLAPRLRPELPWSTWIPAGERLASEVEEHAAAWSHSAYAGELGAWVARQPALTTAATWATDAQLESVGAEEARSHAAAPEIQQVTRALESIRAATGSEPVDVGRVARVASLPMATVRRAMSEIAAFVPSRRAAARPRERPPRPVRRAPSVSPPPRRSAQPFNAPPMFTSAVPAGLAEPARRMMIGVNAIADAVRVTLGPRGRNVVIETSFGAPIVTKDGVTVAKEIELEGKLEAMGAQLVREVASKASDVAGDGTATATVIAQAIYREGARLVAAGHHPRDLYQGIEQAVAAIVEDLRKQARPIRDADEIAQVATSSVNGDAVLGQLLADAFDGAGRAGTVFVEEARSLETSLEIAPGSWFDRGYISPYFVTDPERMEASYRDAYVLFCDHKIAKMSELMPVLEAIARQQRPLLILAHDVEGEALATLVVNKLRGTLSVAAVKAPGFGDRRKAMLRDLAIVTRGQVAGGDTGLALDKVTLAELGRAKLLRVDKDNTSLLSGAVDRAAIEARRREIAEQASRTTSDYDRKKLAERAANLLGSASVIYVSAATEVEMKERKALLDDGLHAVRASLEEGVVPGGGVALVRAGVALEKLQLEGDRALGASIVARAIEAPLLQIAENAGVSGADVLRAVSAAEGAFGYNAVSGLYTDLAADGVLDPVKVVRAALQSAASVAGVLLTEPVAVERVPTKARDRSGEGDS